MEIINTVVGMLRPTKVEPIVVKTVDSVMDIFTTVLNDLRSVAEEATIKAKDAEDQIVYAKEAMARRVADLEHTVKVSVNESERAKSIMGKLIELVN